MTALLLQHGVLAWTMWTCVLQWQCDKRNRSSHHRFQKYVTAGDTVGVRRFNNNDVTEVQFLVNHKCLGTAFRLEPLHPHFRESQVLLSGNRKPLIATRLERKRRRERGGATGYEGRDEGDWKLDSLSVRGDKVVVLPSNCPVVLVEGGKRMING